MTARTVTLLGWALLALAALTLGVVAFVRRGRFASPGNALDLVLWHPAGRALLLAAWVWLGWHVFAR